MTKGSLTTILLTIALIAGCNNGDNKTDTGKKDVNKQPTPSAQSQTLYERLGKEPAITKVVDDFVARAAANPKVNFTRKGTGKEWPATPENVARFKKMLVQFISSNTGGPPKYEGKSMVDAHQGMKITDAEFDALAADLKASLDKFNVPAKEQAELLSIVGGTRGAMVGK
jgi:hemoglobin